MKKFVLCAILALFAALSVFAGCAAGGDNDYSPDKQPGDGAFDYDGNYSVPELTIDGKGDDAQWKAIPSPLTRFGREDAVSVKVYRGESAIFFLFEVKDTVLLTYGEANDDTVTKSDSIEVYLDTMADGGTKPQSDDYQINLGIHGKTRIMQGSGSEWGNWNGLIDYEVALDGTLNDGAEANDTGYSIEVMIPYAQINIEKTDTIGISFGQVDKFGSGNETGTDWNWFGWTFEGTLAEPQTPDNYILLDGSNKLYSRGNIPKPDAEMAGYVLDSQTQSPLEGVTLSTNIGGDEEEVKTDAQGYYTFGSVAPDQSYEVTAQRSGYLTGRVTYTRDELRAADGGRVLKNISLQNEQTVAKTTIAGTVKNVANGIVAGATVRVDGLDLQTESGSDGSFSIANIPATQDVTLIVSKTGYEDSETKISVRNLQADGITQAGDVSINLPAAVAGPFAFKSAQFANSTAYITRTLTGILFRFEGSGRLSGCIELYLDTKDSAATREEDTSCWRFDLTDSGAIEGTHYAGGSFLFTGLIYELLYNGSTGYESTFFIPYSYLGIERTEVFGISLGQWSTSAKDWDGWNDFPEKGFNNQEFVAPELPKDYIRVGARNELYASESNFALVVLSGNAGMAGVTVTASGNTTTTDGKGDWSMRIPMTEEAVEISYSCKGYVGKTTTVPAGYFNTSGKYTENVTLQLQLVTLCGTVTDSQTGAPIEGVTVTVTGTSFSATTNADGEYEIEDIGTAANITLRFEKADYAAQEFAFTAEQLASADTHTKDVVLVSTNIVPSITLTGKISNVNGPVEGAFVYAESNGDLCAYTGADGTFTIQNFLSADGNLIVEKEGYCTKTIAYKASDAAGEDAFDIGTVDLWREYAKLPGLIADKSDQFAKFEGYVTRSQVGFEFRFEGSLAFTGRLELFVDTKTSAGDNARDLSDYLFNLNADGTLTIVNWGEGDKNESVPATMKYTVTGADSKPVLTFTLPYAFFGQVNANMGIASDEVIGISAGQFSSSANDWDGWDNFAMFGANKAAFVKPEMPQDYIRIGARNEIYAKADNTTVYTAEHESYRIRFGIGLNNSDEAGSMGASYPMTEYADDFRAKVERSADSVTFRFISTGDFGVYSTGEREMILIYIDRGEALDGWENVDYLIKIASDGNVYGKAAAWWSAADSDKIGTAQITRENGITTVSYTISNQALGIAADEVFGVAMREAAHNAGDHTLYDPWWDCYLDHVDREGGVDAANASQYIRVAADGTLYRAASNAAANA